MRVFGKGNGHLPEKARYTAVRAGDLDMLIRIEPAQNTVGYVILWGHLPEKLYHSCMTFDIEQSIGALVKNEQYWIRVDAFNESGISKGELQEIE